MKGSMSFSNTSMRFLLIAAMLVPAAFAETMECTVNGAVDASVTDEGACTTAGGTWAEKAEEESFSFTDSCKGGMGSEKGGYQLDPRAIWMSILFTGLTTSILGFGIGKWLVKQDEVSDTSKGGMQLPWNFKGIVARGTDYYNYDGTPRTNCVDHCCRHHPVCNLCYLSAYNEVEQLNGLTDGEYRKEHDYFENKSLLARWAEFVFQTLFITLSLIVVIGSHNLAPCGTCTYKESVEASEGVQAYTRPVDEAGTEIITETTTQYYCSSNGGGLMSNSKMGKIKNNEADEDDIAKVNKNCLDWSGADDADNSKVSCSVWVNPDQLVAATEAAADGTRRRLEEGTCDNSDYTTKEDCEGNLATWTVDGEDDGLNMDMACIIAPCSQLFGSVSVDAIIVSFVAILAGPGVNKFMSAVTGADEQSQIVLLVLWLGYGALVTLIAFLYVYLYLIKLQGDADGLIDGAVNALGGMVSAIPNLVVFLFGWVASLLFSWTITATGVGTLMWVIGRVMLGHDEAGEIMETANAKKEQKAIDAGSNVETPDVPA